MTHDLLTRDEAIAYLRLDAEDGNPKERLRNLMRRHRLPHLKRGRLLRFRRSELDAWMGGAERGSKTNNLAR